MTKPHKYTYTWTFKVPGDYTVDLPEEVREITITCGGAGGGARSLTSRQLNTVPLVVTAQK